MPNIIDIYEAAGGEVNEDRSKVTMSNTPQPFEIVLRVVPTTVETKWGQEDQITFNILLDDETAFGKTDPLFGTPVNRIYHEASVTLPVDQIKIHKADECVS